MVAHIAGVEIVARPGGVVLFGGIAAALDVTFLPVALPGQPPVAYHLAALAITALMIVTTLLHEGGHALAYRVQGIWPVRITLRGSGGACAAMVDEDRPGQALARALAGPAVTALVVLALFVCWRVLALPPLCRLIAATLFVFSLADLLFNTLPVHPRCDGTHALRALLWLVWRREPAPFAVLYLWRPLALAAAFLAAPPVVAVAGFQAADPTIATVSMVGALALCAVPPLAVAGRLLRRRAPLLPRAASHG